MRYIHVQWHFMLYNKHMVLRYLYKWQVIYDVCLLKVIYWSRKIICFFKVHLGLLIWFIHPLLLNLKVFTLWVNWLWFWFNCENKYVFKAMWLNFLSLIKKQMGSNQISCPLHQCFSIFNIHKNHLVILSNFIFWFSGLGNRPEITHF